LGNPQELHLLANTGERQKSKNAWQRGQRNSFTMLSGMAIKMPKPKKSATLSSDRDF
jgi:hypothetical protein